MDSTVIHANNRVKNFFFGGGGEREFQLQHLQLK